jgi:broad specificity phosphatase PhoE
MPSIQPTTIILVRHGQTEWNRVERFRGQADVLLNATGLAQAEATGQRIAAAWTSAAIYSSPLSRAVKTAEAIAAACNQQKHTSLAVQTHAGLSDISFGEWQGLTPEEVRRRWPGMADAWFEVPHTVHIPGGESLDRLRQRAMDAVHQLAHQHTGQTIVLVGHTVVNRVILLGVLGLGNERFWHLMQDTCAINVIEAQGGDFTLASMNDTCHLR